MHSQRVLRADFHATWNKRLPINLFSVPFPFEINIYSHTWVAMFSWAISDACLFFLHRLETASHLPKLGPEHAAFSPCTKVSECHQSLEEKNITRDSVQTATKVYVKYKAPASLFKMQHCLWRSDHAQYEKSMLKLCLWRGRWDQHQQKHPKYDNNFTA